MHDRSLMNVVEAALLAAGRPVPIEQLLELFDERERPEASEIRAAIEALQREYAGRGIELREVASGFRIQVRPGVSATVSRLWQERPRRYSRALLETLALIAYRQPITRGEIEEIRGVAVNPDIIRTLLERSWIRVVGHREVPGHPELLGTTREFLDYFNLKSLDELPSLAELRDMDNLGVQLELPGEVGEPASLAATDGLEAGEDAGLTAAQEDDGTDDEDSESSPPQASGLVARGAGESSS
jgi:segregation and condensation protein B